MQAEFLGEQGKKADQNNLITFALNNPFYLFAPSYYKSYYSMYLRPCIAYYEGSMNVQVGTNVVTNALSVQSITRNMKRKLFANGIDFVGDTGARNKILDWSNGCEFEEKLKESFEYGLAGGTGILKLNKDFNNKYYVTAHRIDNFFIDVNSRGKIVKAKVYIDLINNTATEGDHYLLCEERYFDQDNMPRQAYTIYLGSGNLQTEGYNKPIKDFTAYSNPIQWTAVPKAIRNIIKRDYPNVIFNEPTFLPFYDDLGIYKIDGYKNNPRIPNGQFGQPIADIIQIEAVQYDQLKVFEKKEVKLARARANVPSEYINENDPDQSSTLDEDYYVSVPTGDNANIVPTQFQLRAGDIRTQKENILRDMAFKLGLSTSTVATFLGEGAGAKTATEIISEKTTTDTTFKDFKRQIESEVNKLIAKMLHLLDADVSQKCVLDIKYEGQESRIDTLKINLQAVQSGFMSPELFVKTTYPDLTQEQQKREIDYIYSRIALVQEQNVPQETEIEDKDLDTSPEMRESVNGTNPNK